MSPFQPGRWTGGKRSVRAHGTAAPATAAPATSEPDATDAAKALAADHGIDLASVEGTGSDGRITKDDVQALVDESAGE